MSEVQAEAAAQELSKESAVEAEVILDSAIGIIAKKDYQFVGSLLTSHGFSLSLLEIAEDTTVSDKDFRKDFIAMFKPVVAYIDGLMDARLAQL